MEATLFLAKLFAIYFVVMSVGMIANKKRVKSVVISFFRDPSEFFIAGAWITLLGGAFDMSRIRLDVYDVDTCCRGNGM
ncbi:MAG TPA: hypothetical protein QF873_03925 [Patescibacteria group bacterium]|nr:hypothetical protein [Patescibacteria group bacterium]